MNTASNAAVPEENTFIPEGPSQHQLVLPYFTVLGLVYERLSCLSPQKYCFDSSDTHRSGESVNVAGEVVGRKARMGVGAPSAKHMNLVAVSWSC